MFLLNSISLYHYISSQLTSTLVISHNMPHTKSIRISLIEALVTDLQYYIHEFPYAITNNRIILFVVNLNTRSKTLFQLK